MKRNYLLFLEDILQAIKDIEEFSRGLTEEIFLKDKLKQNAIIRSLELIGEAVKNLPLSIRKKYQNLEWNEIAGLKGVLIHAYFGADLKRIWNLLEKDLSLLKKEVKEIIEKERHKMNKKIANMNKRKIKNNMGCLMIRNQKIILYNYELLINNVPELRWAIFNFLNDIGQYEKQEI